MPRVLVAGKLHPSGLEILENSPELVLDYTEEVSTESLMPGLTQADALLIRTQRLPAEYIDRSPNLKLVSRHGVGCDSIAIDALVRRGIPLAIVGDVISSTVAEHAMTLMLAAAKRLLRYHRASLGPEWNYRNSLEAEELGGKTLLIIGFGRIGRRLAEFAAVFGMRVTAFDPLLTTTALDDDSVVLFDDLDNALAAADYVSLHVPNTRKPLIGAHQLRCMKPTAIVINTARGGVIDEAALVEALGNGEIAAAGIDVYEDEPPNEGHPLSYLDQVILTPHSAGLTRECAERMAVAAAQNIVDFFQGKLDASLVVNADAIGFPPR